MRTLDHRLSGRRPALETIPMTGTHGRTARRPLPKPPAIPVLIPVLLLLFALPSTSAWPAGVPALNRTLSNIVQRQLPEGFVTSVQVLDLATGTVLMEMNPNLPLVPASTMKVVTTTVAMEKLKPDFQFVTEVWADDVQGGSVGNLYVLGKGDPYLVSERLFSLTREVRLHGVEEIRGDIVVDDSYFSPDKPLDESEELTYRSYHAPYGALSVNFNTIRIVVDPADRVGEPAAVRCDPLTDYAYVHGAVTTVKGDAPPRLVIQKESRQGDKAELIRVSGRIGARRPLVSRYVNVAHPAMYAGALFKEFLLREGVRIHGQVVPGKRPGSSKRIVTFEGLPLGMIVYWLNKFSNNFMAEQINLTLGAVLRGPPGTRAKGLSVIRRQLLAMGVNEGAFALAEASGLSRANRLSASALTRVLLTASRNFSYMHEFISSLSIGGVDGTLKDSFRDRRTKGLIRAKTGTLRGVNCLAGYAVCRSGRRIAFAALVNSRNEHTGLIDYSERIVRGIMDLRL